MTPQAAPPVNTSAVKGRRRLFFVLGGLALVVGVGLGALARPSGEGSSASPQSGHEGHGTPAPAPAQGSHEGHGEHSSQAAEPPVAGRAAVMASEPKLERSGVRFGTVEKRPFAKTIQAAGRVEYNERLLSAVNVKFAGWIERLFVSAVGDSVQKNAPLFEIYSPDLLEAQKSYLLAYEAAKEARKVQVPGGSTFAEQNLTSARERLLLWDLSEEQIRQLEERKEPGTRIQIRSKAAGVVTRRNLTVGTYVTPGTELYALADLSNVWVRAEIYEAEIPLVRTGLAAKITFPGLPGEPLEGQIAFIYPSLNEQTRTLEVRIEANNPGQVLKPGMFVRAAIEVDLGPKLQIDEQAVLATGLHSYVFVEEHPGHLVPREITLGPRDSGRVVVERGLSEGERIVTSGTFLVDSESRLRAALEGSGGGGHGGHRH